VYDRCVLVATSETRIGNAGMHTTLVFERKVRATFVLRDRLAYDTRFAAAAAGRAENVGHVFLVVAGRYTPAAGEPIAAPVGFVLADDEIERVGAKSRTFRTDGEQVHVVHLRFERDELRVPIGLAAGPLQLPASTWELAARVVRDPTGFGAILDALASAGVSAGSVRIETEEPEHYRRLWGALAPLYRTHGGTVSLKQLAASLDMSMRQVGRDAKELAATFGFGNGYRDALLVLRLRHAVLLLSAPEATVADVATAVGYGSPIAMARAFRDAKLPAPSAIQAAMRGTAGEAEGRAIE
jgi:AraC-like DNA-binding protein